MNSERPTVFVIDDDRDDQESACALISSVGYSPLGFDSASRFIEQYDGRAPGCVVTDYRMVGLDGLQLQERIAAKNWLLPVIVVSGYADIPVTVRAMKSGAVTLLEKPYEQDELIESISRAIELNEKWRRKLQMKSSIRKRFESLTSGEKDVLTLLLNGLPNKQIARRLEIGLRTVERRRHLILKKMDVDTVAMVARLIAVIEKPPLSTPLDQAPSPLGLPQVMTSFPMNERSTAGTTIDPSAC